MARSLRDYGSVIGLTLLGVSLSLGLWSYGHREERARVRLELEAATESYAASVQQSVRYSELLVQALCSWRAFSQAPRTTGLHAFTTPLVRSLSGVVALEWVPRVRAGEREAFEESMRRAGVEGFVIKERNAAGHLVPAALREEYFPVSDLDPGAEPSPVVGFDLASEESRSSAMTRARRSGRAAATGRLRLVETRDQYGFQIFSPVFERGSRPRTEEQRAEALIGFVVGVFRVSDLVEDALSALRLADVNLEIVDASAGPEGERLYRRRRGPTQEPADRGALSHESRVDVGGRRWIVRTRLQPEAVAARGTSNPLGLLLAGLSMTTLLAVALLVNTRKTAAIRSVNERLSSALRDGAAAHEALRLSELRFRDVIEEQTELIARWGPDGTLSFVSPSLARFLGRPREELEGMTLRAALGETTAGALTAGLSALTPEDPVSAVELPLEDPAGRRFWYSWLRRVRHDDDGRVVHFQAVARDVTVRKHAQQRHREQEERFRRLSEAAFEGIAITHEGRFVDANPQLARLLGCEVGHLLGREVTQFVAPESLPEVGRRIRADDEGPYEHIALTHDGRRIIVEVRARSIVLAGRSMRISAVRDVTEQRRASEELERSQAFLDTIFAGLDIPVWVVDVAVDGSPRPVASNPAWEQLLGVSLAQLGDSSFEALQEALPAQDVRGERTAIERCIVAGGPVREAVSDGLLSGGERDFLRQLNPLRDSSGRIFRVIGTLVEVTELKRAERTLREGQRLLAEAQRIARLGGWEFDLPSGPLRVSEQASSILGEPAQVPPRDAWTWETLESLALEGDRPGVQSAFARLRAGEAVSDHELRFARPDGSVTVVLFSGETEVSASGDAVRIVGTLQDVTERKRAEEAAERQRQELVQADKMIALGTLLSGVAHEINNPNHFILLNLPLLRAVWRDAEPVLDAHAEGDRDFTVGGLPYHELREEVPSLLDEVIGGAERIKFIVSELRGYTREQTHSTAPVSLNDAVRSALTLLANPIKKATRRFSVGYQDDLPRVRGNLRRLEQVVINLILNACQALADPDRAVRVETSHDPEENRAVVTVTDEGSGIPESALARITDPFFTTKRETGGSGLGLAVAARIAEEHGARLSFESEPGRGTTARLSVPVAKDEA